MNSKSRYFSSLLIALVAAFGYYILTDFNVSDIKLKTFSSLGVPFRMYQINNSVKQKKLPLPKVVYAYAVQQDELKTPQVDIIAETNLDAQEFLAGLTGALLESERSKRTPDIKINDKFKYGVRNENPEVILQRTISPEAIPNPNKQICRDNPSSFTVPDKVSKEDIEMIVSTVTLKNVKKIEECFKKIKVIYGNESANMNNVIVNSMQNPNKQTRVSCNTTGKLTSSTAPVRNMRRATSVADNDEEENETPEPDEDTDN
ncbi:MAG: hypothetical protein JST55_02295 [Bacteroidetes bacterium]|nr:hypothetical protein [Bacteroidota bacterium]